jgi:pimeloyl-ACP methyl ester carboxylesterase
VAFSLYLPRPLRAALALVVLLALAGATYQGVTTSLERRRYPHPGRLIDVGGHQLQIHCTGRGTPIVVLEAPAAALSASWAPVQAALESTTRVCSYDRAGLGWSERGDGEFDPDRVPQELQALLAGAGEKPPFVVAGAGIGAAFARAFAVRFPSTVASVVLLDLPADGRASLDSESLGRMPAAMPWLARAGILRLTGTSRRPGSEPAVRAFMNRPDHLTRAASELARWDDAVRLADDDALAGSRVRVVRADLPAPLGEARGAEAAVSAIRRAMSAIRSRAEPSAAPSASR